MSDGEVIQFVPKLVPAEAAPVKAVEVSASLLALAGHLRDFADRIESGDLVALAIVAITNEGDGLRAHHADQRGIALVGMAAKQAYKLAELL
jgi:hypothetical protein